MPNWCSVSINISGKTNEQKKFLEDACDEYNKSIGRTNSENQGACDEFATSISKDEGLFFALRRPPEGKWDYEWCCENWGTKWDINEAEVEYADGELNIVGETAWCPPIRLFDYLFEKGYEVSCYYTETGECFGGEYHNGHDDYHELETYYNYGMELARRVYHDGGDEGNIVGEPTYKKGDLIFWDNISGRRYGIILEADLDPQEVEYPDLPDCLEGCVYDMEFLENNKITGVLKLLAYDGYVYEAVRYDTKKSCDGKYDTNQLVIIQE